MDLEELEEARKNLESQILQKEQERREIEKQIVSLEQEREKTNNKRRFGQINRILNRKRLGKTNELMDLRYELSKKEKNIENLKDKMNEVEEKKEMTALGLYQLSDLIEREKQEMQGIEEETSLVPYQEKEEFKKMDQINNDLRKKENLILFDFLASKYYLKNYLEDVEKIKRNELIEQLKEFIEAINKESTKQLTTGELEKLNQYEETIKKYQVMEENYQKEALLQQQKNREIAEKITIYENNGNYYVNNYVATRFLNSKDRESIQLNGKKLYHIDRNELESLLKKFNQNIYDVEKNIEEIDSNQAAAAATEEEKKEKTKELEEDSVSVDEYEIDDEVDKETTNKVEEEETIASPEEHPEEEEETITSSEEHLEEEEETIASPEEHPEEEEETITNSEEQPEEEEETITSSKEQPEEEEETIASPEEHPEEEEETIASPEEHPEEEEETITSSEEHPEEEEETITNSKEQPEEEEKRSSDIVYHNMILERIKKVQDKIALLHQKENGLLKQHIYKEIKGYESELEKLEELAKETRMEFREDKEDKLERLDQRYKKNQERIKDYEDKIKELKELREQLLTTRKKIKVDKNMVKLIDKIEKLKKSNITCQNRQRRTMMPKVTYENIKRRLLSSEEGVVRAYSDEIEDNKKYQEEMKRITGKENFFGNIKSKYYDKLGIYYKKKLEKASFILEEMQDKDTIVEVLGARVTSLPKRLIERLQESERMNREPSLSM